MMIPLVAVEGICRLASRSGTDVIWSNQPSPLIAIRNTEIDIGRLRSPAEEARAAAPSFAL
jgi:hypothetical protein